MYFIPHKFLSLIGFILLSFASLLGQTSGPAGVLDNTSPGAVFWLRADQGRLTTGSEVTQWNDQIGNGINATGTDGPSISAASLNGQDALLFDGINNNVTIGNSTRINDGASTNRTLFIVFETSGTIPGSGSYEVIYEEGGGTNGLNIYLEDGDAVLYLWENQNSLVPNEEYFARIPVAINSTYIAAIKFEGNGTTQGRVDFYLNDLSNLPLGSPLSMPTANLAQFESHVGDINIGGAPSAGDTQFIGDIASTGDNFNGRFAEMIYYDATLNEAEFLIVFNYLAEKYNVTLGSGDLYNEANYNLEVTGIGQQSGDNHFIGLGNGGALYLENDGGIDSNGEFLLAGHDGTSHGQSSSSLAAPGIERYARSWYIQKRGNINGAKLIFSTTEAGFGAADDNGRTAADYTLLYRASTLDGFADLGIPAVLADDAGAGDGDNDVVFSLTNNQLQSGYYTLGVPGNQTWYSYTTGNWNDPNSWTLDGSSTPLLTNPGNEIPDPNDDVIITNGRTITMNINNVSIQSIEVIGRLVLSNTTGHDFSTIDGGGTIRMTGDGSSNDNFPDGVTTGANGFSNSDNGGTLEIIGNGINLNQVRVFKNVVIDMDNSTDGAIITADYIINGDLTVRKGTFQINNNVSTTSLNIDLFGDMSITANGNFRTGTANARHEFNFYGDFSNLGDARFSQRTSQNEGTEANNGIVDANFIADDRDQQVSANGPTYFYRIEINKGVDDTYILFLETNTTSNFVLTGPADYNLGGDVTTTNNNAFGLIVGTASVGNNVIVNPLNNTGNYTVGTNARLLVAGGQVAKRGGAAITPYGTIEVTAGILEVPSGSGLTTRGAGQIIVSGGEVWVSQIRTSIFGATAVGGFQQTGGTVNVWDYSAGESPITGLAAGNASNSYARFCLTYEGNTFIMSGGTLNLKNATNRGLLFINSDPGNINVTGGTINVYSNVNNESEIASLAPFWDLNIINESTGISARITSQTLTCGPGGVNNRTVTNPDLRVLNNLTIETSTTRSQTFGGDPQASLYGGYLDLCPGNNCVNLLVGGDLTIEDSGVLDVWAWDGTDNDGSATLTFNSTTDAVFYVGDITTYTNSLVQFRDPGSGGRTNSFDGQEGTMIYWELPLYNVDIDKTGATLFLSSKLPGKGQNPNNDESRFKNSTNGGKNVTQYATNLLKITNEIRLLNGTLNQVDPNSTVTITEDNGGAFGSAGDPVGYSIRVLGEVTNQGTFFVYEDGITPKEGIIVLRKDAGNVSLNTTEGASFGNFRLLIAPDVVSLTSNLELGRLEVVDGILDIGSFNLKIDVLEYRAAGSTASVGGGQKVYNENHFIRMAGNVSDGGLSVKVPRSVSTIPDVDEFENLSSANLQNWNREYNQSNIIWFPIGTNFFGTDKYTPALVYLHNNGVTSGDEYITVKVVDNELQTTDLSGGDMLSYYWNVGFEGYAATEEPTVSWLFQYDDSDLDIGAGAESNFVPGKVLDGGTYARSDEGGTAAVKDGGAATNEGNLLGNNPANVIIFNGVGTSGAVDPDDNIETATPALYNNATINAQWQDSWPNVGFTLESANYTAGVANRFIGAPQIFYSRLPNGSSWYNRDWRVGNHWSLVPHDGLNNNTSRPAAGTWPQEGDIAVIGFGGFTGGISPRHSIQIQETDNISVAEIQYNHPGSNGNRIVVYGNATLTFSKIGGTGGTFMQRLDPGDAATISGDFGDFYNTNSFTYSYYLDDDGTFNIIPPTTIFPNLRIEGGANRIAIFQSDILVNNNMTVDGNTLVQTNDGINGDITVIGDLRIGGFRGGNLRFGNAVDRVVEVGRLWLRSQGTCNITVLNSSPGGRLHRLIVNGNILQQRPGQIDLFNGSAALANNAVLELRGTGNHSYTKTNGSVAQFYQIVMSKGNDTTSSFTFSEEFNIPDATPTFKPLEILKGKLIIDNANLNSGNGILIANGSNFNLPNTNNLEASSGSGALEIRQGTLRMEGDGSGFILDGLLRLSGSGNLDLEDAGDNIFIQYTSSGSSQIDITGGSLTVGGQIRRGLTATTGILQFSQSAGSFTVGTQQADANPIRGVFEILNSGSNFTHTGGSFIIAGSNGSTSIPSLILEPETHDVTGSTITIDYSDGDDNFGIRSTIELNNLTLSGSSLPTINLYQLDLNIGGDLIINADNNLDARGFNLNFSGGDFENNGSFVSSGNGSNQQTTSFTGLAAQEIRGNGNSGFYNFEKRGNGILTASKDFLVQNELRILQGTLASGARAINVEGDVVNLSTHTASVEPAGTLYGIILSGSQKQSLSGIGGNVNNISNFGVLAINNPEGALIQDGTQNTFVVDNKLILEQGVLDISSNLFIIGENAVIENENGDSERDAFEASNMVQTNSSFTDFGLQKRFNTGVQTDFVFPVGQQIYTPIEVDMTVNLAGTSPSITVRPANEPHPTIVGHDNSGANSPGTLDDQENVLQYHWIITSNGISSFTGDIIMEYDPSDVVVLDPGDASASPLSFDVRNYAAARLLSSSINWDKSFDGSSFDENNKLIIFDQSTAFNGVGDNSITGDYTAGLLLEDDGTTPLDVGAIPNNVLEYETVNTNGDYTSNTDWNGINGSPALGVGETPNGAIIYVRDGDRMDLTTSGARIYRTVIEEGGVLSIDENADNTRLGIVEGTGTLRIESNTIGQSPQLPAGYYGDFLTCNGGGLEYAGSVNYDVLANIPEVRRVIFSGSAIRDLPSSNLLVCEDFILRDNVSVANISNQQITIQGDVIKSDNGTIDFGNSTILLNGTAGSQQISGDFTGGEVFYKLIIDNANGVSVINNSPDVINGITADVNSDVAIANQLTLSNGLVNTDSDNSLRILLNGMVNDGSNNAYINGPLIRQINNDPSGSYSFPVGKSGRYGLMAVVNPTTGTGVKNWEVEYFSVAPPNPFSVSSGSIEKVSKTEYWSVSDGLLTSGSTQANIRLRWDVNSQVKPTGSINDLVVAYYDGSGWVQVANTVLPSGSTASGSLTGGAVPFSTRLITLGSLNETNTPLPIELLEFTAKAVEEGVLLEWITASEINNERFEIQRYVKDEEFEIIGETPGAGTSTRQISYSYLDKNPLNGTNYYRLRQVDFDGEYDDSPIRSVKFESIGFSNSNNINLYPNPNKGDFLFIDISNWSSNDPIQIILFDVSGAVQYEQLLSVNENGSYTGRLNLPRNLTKSMYLMKLIGGQKVESFKLIIN